MDKNKLATALLELLMQSANARLADPDKTDPMPEELYDEIIGVHRGICKWLKIIGDPEKPVDSQPE